MTNIAVKNIYNTQEDFDSIMRLERRRHIRYPLYTSAIFIGENKKPSLFWVKNLSLGGALVLGRRQMQIGDKYSLLLHLPWSQPLQVSSWAVRHSHTHNNEQLYGICFDEQKNNLLKIDISIRTAAKCQSQVRESVILLIVDNLETQNVLETYFCENNINWITAHTPLDAIRWLHDWKVKISTIIVDSTYDHFDVYSLLRFFSDEHPEVRRILYQPKRKSPKKLTMDIAAQYSKINHVLERIEDLNIIHEEKRLYS